MSMLIMSLSLGLTVLPIKEEKDALYGVMPCKILSLNHQMRERQFLIGRLAKANRQAINS